MADLSHVRKELRSFSSPDLDDIAAEIFKIQEEREWPGTFEKRLAAQERIVAGILKTLRDKKISGGQ